MMGYYANSVDVDFVVPTDDIPAALAAVNEKLGTQLPSLTEAVEEFTGFLDNTEDAQGFRLGYHTDKYCSCTDDILAALAAFAADGSYVRFIGEEDSLFGFQVVDGRLRTESGSFTWTVDPEGLPR